MAFLRNEKGQIIRKDGTVVERAGKGRSAGPRRTKLEGGWVSHLKVDRILGSPDSPLRGEYERLLKDPNTMLKDLHAFLLARGFKVNLTAVNRHRHRFCERFERVRDAAATAAAFCEVTRGTAIDGSFLETAQGRLELMLMRDLTEMADNPKLSAEEWRKWGRALRDAAATRQSVENIRAEYERRAADAAKACENAASAGATGKDVVERMREILGV